MVFKNSSEIEKSITVNEETINDLVVTIYQQLHAKDAKIVQLNWIE